VVVVVDLVNSLPDNFLLLDLCKASKDSTLSISERYKSPSSSSLECGDGIVTFGIEVGRRSFSFEFNDIGKLPAVRPCVEGIEILLGLLAVIDCSIT
jgi:hypothetical protein